jgi:hypothetical protein
MLSATLRSRASVIFTRALSTSTSASTPAFAVRDIEVLPPVAAPKQGARAWSCELVLTCTSVVASGKAHEFTQKQVTSLMQQQIGALEVRWL